uniref:CUB domain-containing protein n=1 Tax=Heterorhabditis bacteriophora TaxID=37862 RepID=A0A1I7X9P0_HETBA
MIDSEYACGSELIPSWEWQEIHNPTIPGKNSGYLPHQHCKWIIERPMLTGLQFKIVMLDLEDAVGCPFDFVAVIADRDRAETDGDDISTGQKFCRNTQVNRTFDYTYNKVLYIHFVSDRSREGQGFVIMYRLTCNSFDYIKSSYGLFNHILTSPQYPNSRINEKCSWSVVLQSNRRILIEILDLDIEYTQDCTNDALVVSPRSLQIETHSKFQSRYCGKLNNLEKANQTLPVGRLFIKYSNTFTEKKGFKLYITEISEECNSEHLYVDENEMSKLFTTPHYPATSCGGTVVLIPEQKYLLTSPNYPDAYPSQTDCEWTVRTPNSHMVEARSVPVDTSVQRSCTAKTRLQIIKQQHDSSVPCQQHYPGKFDVLHKAYLANSFRYQLLKLYAYKMDKQDQ